MNIETKITLDSFQARDYQKAFFKAMKEKKRGLLVWPRQSGKDQSAFNYMIRAAALKTGYYAYVLPTYSQAKKTIWNYRSANSGKSFFDWIPKEWIKKINQQDMTIHYHNNTIIQLVGSDNVDSLVGVSIAGAVFSEYALQSPLAFQYLLPAIKACDGWAVFVSTPRGKNHLYELYEMAQHSPNWFVSKLTLDDTKHVTLASIEEEKALGIISDDLIMQEWFTSFQYGVEGSYYSKYIDKLRLNNRIGQVPWDESFPVFTCWDLGVRDSTCIIFYQIIGQTIKIIDAYEKNKEGLEHYVNVVKSKPYAYSKHYAPHDINVMEFGSGITRYEKAKRLGLKFEMTMNRLGDLISAVPNISIMDGIEQVRSTFGKIWIDEINCKDLLKALENYRQEYDARTKTYASRPLHNWASHYADCLRYLCLSLSKTEDGLSAQELDNQYNKHMNRGQLSGFFQDDDRRY